MANADVDQEETEGSILDLDIFSEEFDDEEPSASQSVNPNQINLPNKESFIKLPYGAETVESPNEESANDAPSAEEGKGGFLPFSSFFDINFNDIYGKKILSNVIQRYASQLEKKDFFTDTKKRGLKPKLHNELFSDNINWNNKSFRGNVWNTNKTIKSNIGLPIEKEIKKSNEKKNIINLKIEKKVNAPGAEKRNINLMVEKKVQMPITMNDKIDFSIDKKTRQGKNFFQINTNK